MGNIRYRHSTDEQLKAALDAAMGGDQRAVVDVVAMTAPIVFNLYKKKGIQMPREDLKSLAHEVVLDALAKYDGTREDARFTGLVVLTAHKAFDEHIKTNSSAFSMGQSRLDKGVRRQGRRFVREGIEQGLSMNEAMEAAAARIGVKAQDLAVFFGAGGRHMGFEDDEEGEYSGLAGDGPEPTAGIVEQDRTSALEEAMGCLTERQAEIVRLYTQEGLSFDKISARYGVCRERSRQEFNKAMEKLRAYMQREGLSLDDLI
jgi:RNA polymerase sigma factor (sigma-70 family)